MERVTFLRFENVPGRSTILLDGRGCGYIDDKPGANLLLTRHFEQDELVFLQDELLRLRAGKPIGKTANPEPFPPEWLAEQNEAATPDDYDEEDL